APPQPQRSRVMKQPFRIAAALTVIAGQLALSAAPAAAFCGFYVAKADAKLFNRASKVVLAWNDGRTPITMANDYEGDPRDFAVVVPVPTFIKREQIDVGEMATIDHLDAYTAPRLVEYFDPDPCRVLREERFLGGAVGMMPAPPTAMARQRSHGVTVEATY